VDPKLFLSDSDQAQTLRLLSVLDPARAIFKNAFV
jgi:hypothetical protein